MERILQILLPAIPQTLLMVVVSSIIAISLGLPLGVILYITQKDGLSENQFIYKILDGIINMFRSLPFVVLMLVVFPLSLLIVGKRIGTEAAIVPLTVSAIPFVARLMETYLDEVDKGIIEAARAMGSNTFTIVRKVLIREAMPQIINGITMTVINLIGLSAIAGIIGGGGLGDVANRYGYQRNQTDILWAACIVIIILVQSVQFIGNRLSKSINKK